MRKMSRDMCWQPDFEKLDVRAFALCAAIVLMCRHDRVDKLQSRRSISHRLQLGYGLANKLLQHMADSQRMTSNRTAQNVFTAWHVTHCERRC